MLTLPWWIQSLQPKCPESGRPPEWLKRSWLSTTYSRRSGTHLGLKVDFPPVLVNQDENTGQTRHPVQLVQTKPSDRATVSSLSDSVDPDRILNKSWSGWKREHKQLQRGYLSGVTFYLFFSSRGHKAKIWISAPGHRSHSWAASPGSGNSRARCRVH